MNFPYVEDLGLEEERIFRPMLPVTFRANGISNTLREDTDGSAAGQAVIIDANTGEVMDEIMSWIRTP